MADPAFTSPTDAETLTASETTITWSAGTNPSTYRVVAAWTQTYLRSDDTTTSQSLTRDSGLLPKGTLSTAFTLPCDGETVTLTLYWEGGSTAITVTAVNQPEYQKSSRYYRDDAPRWWQCERCGFLYPMDETTIDPLSGLRVCQVHCVDAITWGDDVLITGRDDPVYPEERG